MISQSPNEANSPYNIAADTGRALKRTDSGYTLSAEMSMILQENQADIRHQSIP